MFKLFSITLLILCSTLSYAQKSKLKAATKSFEEGKLEETIEVIKKVCFHKKTYKNPEAWFLRGRANGEYFMNNGVGSAKYPTLFEMSTSVFCFEEAAKMDASLLSKPAIMADIKRYGNEALTRGIGLYNKEEYKRAFIAFENCAKYMDLLGITDTLALYNVALSAEKQKDYKTAIGYYQRCADVGYKGATTYYFLINCFNQTNDQAGADKALAKGLEKYPNNQTLLTTKVNQLIKQGRQEEAINYLTIAIEGDPSNAVLHFSRASLRETAGIRDGVEEGYLEALELQPEYFDALFNLGAFYFNQGADVYNVMVETDDEAKYERLEAKSLDFFRKAQAPLEKALALKPGDTYTVRSLKQIYIRLDLLEKYEALK